MRKTWVPLTSATSLLLLCVVSAAHGTTYSSNSNIAAFTSQVNSYATFTNFASSDGCASSPFTPTASELAGPGTCRVYNGTYTTGLPSSNNWILATFPNPVSSILVFPNIDHPDSWDAFQYQIYGSNDGKIWTALYDTTSVAGSGPYTIGAFTGTAPTSVNNTTTPGSGPGGVVGYEAQFDFGTAYSMYAFGTSTVGMQSGNNEQELSAVGAASSTPEPGSLVLFGSGLGILAGVIRRKTKK